MNVKKAISVGVLVICGALVLFVTSSDTAMSSGAADEEALVHSVDEIGNRTSEEMTEWLDVNIPKEILIELQEIVVYSFCWK